MTRFSVNVNKIALLRNSRGADYPNVLDFSQQALDYGADGITVHPRPDERHITYDDVADLKLLVSSTQKKELNVEGYPSSDFIDLICEVKPDQVTFVPDPPDALTSSFGWDVTTHLTYLSEVITQVKEEGVRTSLFIDSEFSDLNALIATQVDCVEFYTGPYALEFDIDPNKAVYPYIELAKRIHQTSIKIHAGHDLNLKNTAFFLEHVTGVAEVSIGHAVVCDALLFGWEAALKRYQNCLS